MNGINEELFAGVYRRQGRTAWIEEHRRRGIELLGEKEGGSGYKPFRSDSGIAVSLRHWEEDGEFRWQLDYEKDGRLHKAYGRGRDEAVDLNIRPLNEVGFFILHRAPLVRFWPGKPLWMRSGDLSIRPEDVWMEYAQRSGATAGRPSTKPLSPNISGSNEAHWTGHVVSHVDGDTVFLRLGDESVVPSELT